MNLFSFNLGETKQSLKNTRSPLFQFSVGYSSWKSQLVSWFQKSPIWSLNLPWLWNLEFKSYMFGSLIVYLCCKTENKHFLLMFHTLGKAYGIKISNIILLFTDNISPLIWKVLWFSQAPFARKYITCD